MPPAVAARRSQPVTTPAPPAVSRESTPRRILRSLADRVGLNEPVRRNLAARIQASAMSTLGSLRISSPSDPAEREAESTARRVMTMGAPPVRAQGGGPVVARAATGPATASAAVSAEVARRRGGGSPLPQTVRSFMEPRFRADFRRVRVHTDEGAARLSRMLNAHAFTVGSDIFFARGAFNPNTREGAGLLAHELTHTIQQGAAAQEPQVSRSEDPTVRERTGPQAQRFGVSDALDYFAEQANSIPGFRMFTIVLGVNPVNMNRVERSAANIMRAVVEFLPGGVLITQALDNHGVFDRVGNWVEQQIRTLGMAGSVIRDAINRFVDGLSWSDVFDLGGVWTRARRIFSEPIDRLLTFARGLIGDILKFIKDAILIPLARLAEGTRGYDLLKAVLGRDPVTGDAVPRTAETLIGGFMRLIGQEEIWQNIQRSNAIPRAWAWFQGALNGLMAFVGRIPQMFIQAFQELQIADIVLVPRAFARIASVFGGFIGEFLGWAGGTIWNLLEIIFEVVAPQVMVYLRRAQSAFRTILRDPMAFVRNLMQAGMLGLRQFAGNFLTHLRASLIGWLTGAMAGANIYIPQGFSLMEIVKFVLSVLGLTWQNIRGKLVTAIGETAVTVLETTFDIVMTLVREGPAAAWDKIVESLTNLRDMVIEQVMTFVRDRVVQAAITRLLSMLSPVGAFIQAIIGIYNTVMFFVERMRQIAQVAAGVIDAIAAIAAGVIQPAANRVETTMAGLLTLVISFLARIAGLGRVSDAVTSVIDRVRRPIDRALDRVVAWIVTQARRLGRAVVSGARAAVQAVVGWWTARQEFRNRSGETHTLSFRGTDERARMIIASDPIDVEDYLRNYPNKSSPEYARAKAAFDETTGIEFSFRRPNAAEAQLRRDIIQRQLAKVSAAFAALAGAPPADYPPTTAPTYSSGKAGSNAAQYLVGDIPEGTAPPQGRNSGTPGWGRVFDAGLTRQSDRWVQMHVVSERLGGRGQANNLVSAPNSINTGYFRSFEAGVRNLARAAASGGIRNVVWLEVVVTWRSGADSDFAETIAGSAGLYAWMGSHASTRWLKNRAASLSARAVIPRPNFHEQNRVSLNFSSGTDLRGVIADAALVSLIRNNRPYTTRPDFQSRVTTAAATAGIAQYNQKIAAILANPSIVLGDVSGT